MRAEWRRCSCTLRENCECFDGARRTFRMRAESDVSIKQCATRVREDRWVRWRGGGGRAWKRHSASKRPLSASSAFVFVPRPRVTATWSLLFRDYRDSVVPALRRVPKCHGARHAAPARVRRPRAPRIKSSGNINVLERESIVSTLKQRVEMKFEQALENKLRNLLLVFRCIGLCQNFQCLTQDDP